MFGVILPKFQVIFFLVTLTSLCKANKEDANKTEEASTFPSWQPPPPKQYNYDFDFEKAVMSGISPSQLLISNDTSLTSSGIKSSPGCPEPYDEKPWIYYGAPTKCYLPGYQWPCKDNMILMPQGSSFYGYCDCACKHYTGYQNTPQSFCLGKDANGHDRILAYRKEWDSCHFIFDQTKCNEGDWLVFADNPLLGPYCEKRRCPKEIKNAKDGIFSFFDYRTNLCHKIGDECNRTITFGNKQVVATSKYSITGVQWTPDCDTGGQAYATTYSITESDCTDGQKFSQILKTCVPAFSGIDGGIG